MTVGHARDAARQWVMEEGAGMPGFRGAYTAGSTNWLPDDAELPAASDFDIMIVLADSHPVRARRKFRYRDVLLEASHLTEDQLRSPDLVLSDYHLAPSLQSGRILLDPSGHLAALRTAVCRDYASPQWVRRRCDHARERVLACTRSIEESAPLHDQVVACLFGAGITTHILLAYWSCWGPPV